MLPEGGVKGRGLAYSGSRILEYQTALALEAENDYQRIERIQNVCMQMKTSWQGKIARAIPSIPEKPVWSKFSATDEYRELQQRKDYIPVGYDMENAEFYGIPLREMFCYLVCGSARTGKTNFMKVFIQAVLDKKAITCIIDGPDKKLQSYRNCEEMTYLATEEEIDHYFGNVLTPLFQIRNARKKAMLNEDYEESEIYEEMSKEKPHFIFISDMAWFIKMVYTSGLKKNMNGFLENIISLGRLHNIYFVAELALNKVSEVKGYQVFEFFAGYKTGIHFGGKVSENTLLPFEHMQYKEKVAVDKIGIGSIAVVDEHHKTQKIVVPLARK